MNKTICVNAISIKSSGALTILNQFIDAVSSISVYKFFIFINSELEYSNEKNLFFFRIRCDSWFKRIIWDDFGFNKTIKKMNLNPILIFSLQNTSVKYSKNIPQIIYYHQPIPLNESKWNPLKGDERVFFLYKHIYPYFIKKHINHRTHFIVQIPSIKTLLMKKIKIKDTNVFVLRPFIKYPLFSNEMLIEQKSDIYHFIYPATPIKYKNHEILLYALKYIKDTNNDIGAKIRISFTFSESSSPKLFKLANKFKITENIIFEGLIPHNDLMKRYQSFTGLLFPSYIETYGMPLVEAAYAGIPIIVSDEPYAMDVISHYEGVSFIEKSNIKGWAEEILKCCKEKKRYPRYNMSNNDWDKLEKIINTIIHNARI